MVDVLCVSMGVLGCEGSGIAVFGAFFGSTWIRRIVAECKVFLMLWDVVGLDD